MIQTIILCGGSGTRLKEMSEFIPKPLIPIGGIPMIVHIMRLYAYYNFKDFVLALGYKQDAFKQYFAHYDIINNDVTLNIGRYQGDNYRHYTDQGWKVTLSDTGEATFKGARLKRVEKYVQGDTFMCTYGDGIGDIDIPALLAFHQYHGKIATVTGVHPSPRFGEIHHDNGKVISFSEKPHDDNCLVNGGFMCFNRGIFDYLTVDPWCDLEVGPLELLAAKGELQVYHHRRFWKAMDTLKDMGELQTMWDGGHPKWKVW
jgi:glucose-1-phosphate cytidylyltransferase